MDIAIVKYNSKEERKAAFLKMVHAKDEWEARMRAILMQKQTPTA